MDVTVSERADDGITVVALHGELGVDTAPQVETTLTDLIRNSVDRIVVDLSGLRFCDSIGLSTFVVAHRACTSTGGYVRLAAPPEFLMRVLTVVGLSDQLPIYDTVTAACAG
ncbi:MAG TPA: STAS domain-containing protein [Micromonosporaceae bacterium]|nr:STAS domain-containing protein [Micromonosporaceae bacterium]